MTGIIATIPQFQFNGANGLALSGGTLTTYLAGTTTLETTYQDQALTIANTNPIVLDAAGGCTIWLSDAKTYKFVLKNSAGVTQWTQDNINGTTSLSQLTASSGSSLVGYLPSGTGAVATTVQAKLREAPVSLYDFGGTFAGDCIAAMDLALASGATTILVPDNVTLGKHTITTSVKIIGGKNVTFSTSVVAAGFVVGTSNRVEITGFQDCVLKTYPDTGGVIVDGHVFVSLASGCTIKDLFIHKNSGTGGRIAISAGFESGRTLTGCCAIYENEFTSQNGGLGGEGYGIHYANETDTGYAYLSNNSISLAGRHSFYIARNKSAPVTLIGNTAINHRENATTKGVEVRSAFAIFRSNNVTGYGNTINGFYDSAIMVSEETEAVATPLNAENVRFYGTTIKNPKNVTAAVWAGYTGPSATAIVDNVLFDGLTFESTLDGSQVFQYSWGRGVKFKNLNITYKNTTAGSNMLLLQGNTLANSGGVTFEGVSIHLLNCAGAFNIMRPNGFFLTNNIPLTIRDVKVVSNTGTSTVTDWNPSGTMTNTELDVFGFTFPSASTASPKQTIFPSLISTLTGSAAWDPASVPVGSRVVFNVTVTGAVMGDFCIPSFSLSLATMSMTASVEASNTVTVCLTNNSGSAVDLASGTVKVLVIKRA